MNWNEFMFYNISRIFLNSKETNHTIRNVNHLRIVIMHTRSAFLGAGLPARTRWQLLVSIARAGSQRGRVSATLMYIVIRVWMTSYLNFAPAALAPRYRWLRVLHVPPLSQRHASDRHWPVCCLRLLYINLTVINHPLVLVCVWNSLRCLLELSAKPFLCFRHGCDSSEFL